MADKDGDRRADARLPAFVTADGVSAGRADHLCHVLLSEAEPEPNALQLLPGQRAESTGAVPAASIVRLRFPSGEDGSQSRPHRRNKPDAVARDREQLPTGELAYRLVDGLSADADFTGDRRQEAVARLAQERREYRRSGLRQAECLDALVAYPLQLLARRQLPGARRGDVGVAGPLYGGQRRIREAEARCGAFAARMPPDRRRRMLEQLVERALDVVRALVAASRQRLHAHWRGIAVPAKEARQLHQDAIGAVADMEVERSCEAHPSFCDQQRVWPEGRFRRHGVSVVSSLAAHSPVP